MGEVAAYGANGSLAREVLFDTLSLVPIGGEKNVESIGEVAIHGTKSLYTREDNIMPIVNGWIS